MRIIKFLVLFISSILLLNMQMYAQNLGIGPNTFDPDPSAGVEMRFSNKGLLIPRVALTSTNSPSPITSPANSLLIYNTATTGDVTPGYYYWTGSKWMRLLAIDDKPAWLLSGNAGTTAGTNFIGTTDEADVVFKANSTEIMRITSKRYVGIGTAYPTAYPSGNSPTLLHIYDPGSSTTDFALLQLGAYKSSVNGKVGEINFHANIAATDRRTACVESYISNVSGSNVAGDLRFSTNNLGGCAERMRIDPNGNVGIGTTTPQRALHVASYAFNDGFEDGTLSPFTTGGTADWAISTTSPYAGSYCAESGVIGNSQSTYIQLTQTLSSPGQISFAYKTSSESCCDKLKFYIDGVEQANWGGEIAWTVVSFSVGPGSHTFKWEYSKDYSVNGGSDKVWIDEIKISNLSDLAIIEGNTDISGNTNIGGNAIVNGSAGIGITSPTKKLQVNGTFGVDIDNNSTSPPHTGYIASTDIAYSRDDISEWSSLFGSGTDDAVSSEQSIGFTFNLFGSDYTTFYVSTNGFIAFGTTPGSSRSNSALPTSTFSMPVICPYWDDMKTTGNGIRTTLLGSSPNRVRIIDFELITYTGSYAVTFQVILHEKSNLISIRYYLVAPDACGQSATIGIQGPGGSVATAVPISCNAKVLDDNFEPLSISFCPVIY